MQTMKLKFNGNIEKQLKSNKFSLFLKHNKLNLICKYYDAKMICAQDCFDEWVKNELNKCI